MIQKRYKSSEIFELVEMKKRVKLFIIYYVKPENRQGEIMEDFEVF